MPRHYRSKNIKTFKEIASLVNEERKRGKTIITTNGVFDILHIGHVRYLEAARALGDVLIVGVNSDASTRINKGPKRPIVPEKERAEMVASLKPVDHVFIFNEKTPIAWLKKLKPHVHVKGGDRRTTEIIERDALKAIGSKLVLIRPVKGKSTTNFLRQVTNKN